jgi:GNAT superfamily N-acetyltransferase
MLPSGYTADEILHEVLQCPRNAYVALPDLRVIERPGWKQLVTPSFARGGFNEVAYARLDEADADRVIAETIEQYRAAGIAFRWTVGPDSAPADLAARLARTGMTATSSAGMARATLPPGASALVEVSAVDACTVDAFTHVMAAGWGSDPGPLATAHAAVLADGARRHRLFLASVDGEPAGAASYVAFPRAAYLLGAVVLEPFRRRGVYRALVAARLADARAQGIELATTMARLDTSAPLLAKLGFVEICRFTTFQPGQSRA